MGGVAIVVGADTGKILHVGVRNKSCHVFTVASSIQCNAKKHNCFSNWTASSRAMESDIILEAFNQCEEIHGARYMRVIAVGDSSTMAAIHGDNGPSLWRDAVVKHECANHSTKFLRGSLERLQEQEQKSQLYNYPRRVLNVTSMQVLWW